MKKSMKFLVATLKPRNAFAVLAGQRHGGQHAANARKREANKNTRDLVQRLREAGL